MHKISILKTDKGFYNEYLWECTSVHIYILRLKYSGSELQYMCTLYTVCISILRQYLSLFWGKAPVYNSILTVNYTVHSISPFQWAGDIKLNEARCVQNPPSSSFTFWPFLSLLLILYILVISFLITHPLHFSPYYSSFTFWPFHSLSLILYILAISFLITHPLHSGHFFSYYSSFT